MDEASSQQIPEFQSRFLVVGRRADFRRQKTLPRQFPVRSLSGHKDLFTLNY